MGFQRPLTSATGKLLQPLQPGDGFLANVKVHAKSDDAAATLTVQQVAGGFIHQAGTLTAGRILTTPTAALLAAGLPEMEIGDSFAFLVTNGNAGAFAITLAGGADVTLVGSGAVPQFGSRIFVLVKTAAEEFDLY